MKVRRGDVLRKEWSGTDIYMVAHDDRGITFLGDSDYGFVVSSNGVFYGLLDGVEYDVVGRVEDLPLNDLLAWRGLYTYMSGK